MSSIAYLLMINAVNDIACIGAMSAAQQLGLRVPQDVSLVGYDNTSLAQIRHLIASTLLGVDPPRLPTLALVRSGELFGLYHGGGTPAY